MSTFNTKLAFISCLAIVLTGCGTKQRVDDRALDEAACVEYGLKPNSDAFALCIQNEVNARKQRAAAVRAANTAAIVWGD